MSLTAAELRAVYSVDERPLDRSLAGLPGKVGRVGDATEQTTSRMSGAMRTAAGAIGGFFAFGAVQSGVQSLIGPASDLNETVNKATTIFGSNAAQIQSWARGAAQNLGLSRQEALAAAAGFGDMFSQIGFAGDEAAKMSTSVVQMAADLGSFNNLPTADVADRISAAFRGEYDSLQALIPNINAARVESEAMAATGKTVASELTAQEKAAAVLAIVNKDGARAMGDFAKTSDGAANAAKIASAQWADQRAEIGQRLLPAWTMFIGFLSSNVIPAVGTVVDGIMAGVGALQQFAQWVQANQTPILVVAGLLATVFGPGLLATAAAAIYARGVIVASWLAQTAAGIAAAAAHSLQVARMVAGWVLLGAQALIQGARIAAGWVLAMGPVGWVIAAVVGLVALIIANWDKVRTWTVNAWNAVSGAVRGAWTWIQNATGSAVAWVVGRFVALRDGIVSMAGRAMDFIRGLPRTILNVFANAGSWLLSAGGDIVRGLWNGIQGLAGWLWDKVVDWAGGIVDGVLNFFGISSPSKVMAEVGKNLALGMAKGIDREGSRAVQAALRTARGVRDAMTVTAPGIGMGAGGIGSPALAGGGDMGAGGGAGGRGALFSAEQVNIIEGTPTDVARQLELGARTRGAW